MNPILTVDPGKMTGWGMFRDGKAVFGQAPFEDFHDMAYDWFDGCVALDLHPLVVCERFVISGGTSKVSRGDTNWSIETIGVIRWMTHKFGFDFELQGAGDAKNFGSGPTLKKLGWWTRGSDHARDAASHLVLALGRHHPSELDRLLLDAEHRARS